MDVTVSLDQNLNIQFHQAFKANQPLSAVHVRIWRCKIASHECIAREQQFFLGIVQNDVVIAMAGCRDYLKPRGERVHSFA